MVPRLNATFPPLLIALMLIASTGWSQDERAACITNHENAQVNLTRGELLTAKKELEACSRDVCPKLIAADCSKWWEESQAKIPSLVIELGATKDARVTLDGAPVPKANLGREMPVDPGEHIIRAERPGHAPFEQKVDLAEGQKSETVRVKLRALTTSDGDAGGGETATGTSTWTWVVGGVGLAALTGFGVFAVIGTVRRGDLDDADCKPRCDQGAVDAMSRDFVIADVLLGVGLVTMSVATVLLFTTSSDDGDTDVALRASAAPGAATLQLSATF
jgi:hypothetical protein